MSTDLRSGGPCERQNAKLRVRKLEKNASVGGKKSAWIEQCRISLPGVSTMVEPQIAGVGQIGWPPVTCVAGPAPCKSRKTTWCRGGAPSLLEAEKRSQKLNIRLLKSIVVLSLAQLCPSAYAQTEELCLGIGKFAQSAANLMHLGQPEEQVLAIMLDPAMSDAKRPKAQQKMLDERDTAVVNWVYTVRPSAPHARATVYAKCMAGGLGSLDMAKFKAAGKNKQR